MKFAFKDCIWTVSYIVVKVLSNNNYVVRRTGTRYTQTLHRIRLRIYVPNQRVPDVTVRGEDYLPDPEVKTTHNDWYAQAWETEFGEVLFGASTETSAEETTNTEITNLDDDDATNTQNEMVKTTTDTNFEEDKISFDSATSFNLDVSDNPYIITPPPITSPPPPKKPAPHNPRNCRL